MNIYSPIKCLICDKEFQHHNALTNHLKLHNLNSKSYYDKYLKREGEEFCNVCGVLTRYRGFIKGYTLNCHSCASRLSAQKQWSGKKGQNRKKSLSSKMKNNTQSKGRPKGSKNKNPYPMSEKVLDRFVKNPPPSWKNKKHTKETLEKMSTTRVKLIRENGGNMAYRGKFSPKNPQKYKGDYTNIVWRSTWECKYMSWLDKTDSVISWSSEEIVIPYKDPLRGHTRRYFVDFYVQMKNKNNEIVTYLIEIKPKYQTIEPIKKSKITKKYINEVYTWGVNSSKWKAAEEYAMDRGWKFKILTEDDLGLIGVKK